MSTVAESTPPGRSARRSRKSEPESPSSKDQNSSSASEPPSPTLVYVARKRMRVQGKWLQPGDVVPEANDWPRVESMVRAGFLNEEMR